jgi:3-oxoacyl-[acyl-carrier protein] reductase
MTSPSIPTVTLVTGASRGIGRAVCELLAKNGHRIIGIARKAEDPNFPGELIACDVLNAAQRKAVLADIAARHAIDNLVNNVGLTANADIADITPEHYHAVMEANVASAIAGTQAVLPAMRTRKKGRIVNVASRAMLGRSGRSVYSAAKAGVVGLTRTWALELATDGITVNCISPGPIATENFRRLNPRVGNEPTALEKAVPMGRLGEPSEIAGAVAYFLSDAAAFTTGQVLHVCGGLSVGYDPI